MLHVEVIEGVARARALFSIWDEFAVACALPLCAPGWMLSWWSHLAPPNSELRVLAVRDGSEVIAIAPWFVQAEPSGRVDLRFLGAELSDRVSILCVPGREREVAAALRAAIVELDPKPHLAAFEAVPLDSGWTRHMSSGVGGRMRLALYRNSTRPAPFVTLPSGAPEQWLEGRSSKFRKHMRRQRRLFEQRGGTVRHIRDPAEMPQALEAMLALHAGRWEGREESGLARPGVAEALSETAAALGPDRLRLWSAELDGEPISVQMFIAAGGTVKFWNGGWSEQYAEMQPSMLTVLSALEDAIARGEQRLDMGAGNQPYKLRFSDGEDTLAWEGVIVRGLRWPLTRAELLPRTLPYHAKRALRRLPSPISERLETVARERRGSSSS